MQENYKLPLPTTQPESDYYWEMAKAHELWLRKCNKCDEHYFYPRNICPQCYSDDVVWTKASGRAVLHAYSIVERGPTPAFREMVPYVAAVVELEEGPRMPTNLTDLIIDEEHIKIGMPLQVTFEDVTDEISLPKFRPA